MTQQEQFHFKSFEEMMQSIESTIQKNHSQPRSIKARVVVENETLRIQVREAYGSVSAITVSERSHAAESWKRTTLNVGFLATQGEVQLMLPSDGMHPREGIFVSSINELPRETSELLARGLSIL